MESTCQGVNNYYEEKENKNRKKNRGRDIRWKMIPK